MIPVMRSILQALLGCACVRHADKPVIFLSRMCTLVSRSARRQVSNLCLAKALAAVLRTGGGGHTHQAPRHITCVVASESRHWQAKVAGQSANW